MLEINFIKGNSVSLHINSACVLADVEENSFITS